MIFSKTNASRIIRIRTATIVIDIAMLFIPSNLFLDFLSFSDFGPRLCEKKASFFSKNINNPIQIASIIINKIKTITIIIPC